MSKTITVKVHHLDGTVETKTRTLHESKLTKVGSNNGKPVKSTIITTNKENNETRRAKPAIIKQGLTKEKTPYKHGGFVK